MSTALATGGLLSPLLGGGGGSGASGHLIFFALRDTDGVLQAGVNLSGAGEVQVDTNGGGWNNRAGNAPTSVGAGLYYYEWDASEFVSGKIHLKVAKTGYQTIVQEELVATSTDEAITTIVNAVNTARDTVSENIANAENDILAAIGAIPNVGDIDDQLSGTHGGGSWEGATAAAIDTQLSGTHGAGSWEGAGSADIIATAVMNKTIEGSIKFADAVRGILSLVGGPVTDFRTGVLVFKSQDNSKTRFTITCDKTGRISVVAGDLT